MYEEDMESDITAFVFIFVFITLYMDIDKYVAHVLNLLSIFE